MIKEPRIIFHHIPKCGGTSIVTGIAMAYYPWRLLSRGKKGFPGRLNAPEATQEAEVKGKDRYQYRRELLATHIEKDHSPFISGHYPFNHDVYDAHKDEWRFVTLLRDPAARWYSEYFWNRYKDHEYRKTELSVEEYLESEDGVENAQSFLKYFSRSDDLSEALATLPKFTVIGCLKNIERFRSDMKDAFGRKPIFFNRNSSPAPKGKQIKPDKNSDIHKKLLRLLAPDIEIYMKAKEQLKL